MGSNGEWAVANLGEIADEVTVGFVGPMTAEYVDAGIPFLRSQNVEPFNINSVDLKYINKAFHLRLNKSRLCKGDVVIVRTGKPGTAAVVPDWLHDANCSDLVIVRPGCRLHPRFLAYFVNSAARNHVYAHVVGAVQQHFNVGSAKEIAIPLPSMAEQEAIVRVLGILDDKIELNRRMNRTLETLARAMFKSWFVDFDPVVAKTAGKKPIGMSAETAALFPDRFQDSVLGQIPKGWRVAELPTEIDFLEGPGLRNWQYKPEGMRFLNIRCIGNGDLDTGAANAIDLHEFESKYQHFALCEDDIVISTSGTLGRLAIVRREHLPIMLNTSIIRLRGRDALGLSFVWAFLQSDYFVEEMFAAATGSVQLNFGPVHLKAITVIRPTDELLRRFECAAAPILRKSLHNRQHSEMLAALRDALLPQLMSGELRVKQAEALLEEAGCSKSMGSQNVASLHKALSENELQ